MPAVELPEEAWAAILAGGVPDGVDVRRAADWCREHGDEAQAEFWARVTENGVWPVVGTTLLAHMNRLKGRREEEPYPYDEWQTLMRSRVPLYAIDTRDGLGKLLHLFRLYPPERSGPAVRAEAVARGIELLRVELRENLEKVREAERRTNDRIEELRKICPHLKLRFNAGWAEADPYYECPDCGALLDSDLRGG